MTNAIRAPFPWFGGKDGHKIKDAILSALPPHKRYLEPFGGGASILISKQPATGGSRGLQRRQPGRGQLLPRHFGRRLFRQVHGAGRAPAGQPRALRGVFAHMDRHP